MAGSAVGDDRRFTAIDAMLHPKSIAIVGATERLQYGGRFLNNLLATSCKAKLYPVNPKRDSTFGVPCFHSIGEIPEPVDLAAIIIPASAVLDALLECARCGAKSAVVISAGFAELATEEGRTRQARLRAIARETGVRVCGPNCLGLANVADSTWATGVSRLSPETAALYGEIGLVSQSGATCFGPLIATARDRAVGFRYIVSSGNEADLESSDFLQYMLRDPEVRVVAALIEGFRDGDKFVRTAEMALEADKPLVLLKVGRSEVGARAAGSHTAAMTGSDAVQDALFKQKGVVRVDDYDELIETASMFLKGKRPRGNRVGVVSHSGGIGSFLADKCGEAGLELPLLSDETRDGLGAILGERGSAANPADVTGFALNESFPSLLRLMLADESLDLQIVASGGGELQARTVLQVAEESEKPVVFLWTGSTKDTTSLPLLQAGRVPLFYLPGHCAKGVRRLLDYHATREALLAAAAEERAESVAKPPEGTLPALRALVAGHKGLSEHQSKQALALFGVPATREILCHSLEEALHAAAEIRYPVALKVISPQIPHKTEAGAVRLGLSGPDELAVAYEQMLGTVRARCPAARIEGVLVQQMVSGGIETIAGISRDPQFGPVLMLGLGGVLVEALGAVAWRICPIGPADARAMIHEVKGLALILGGYRGLPKADIEALVGTLVRLSRLAVWAKDEIASLDINPLAVLPEGRGVVALDALIVPR